MKKVVALILAVVMMLGLVACQNTQQAESPSDSPSESVSPSDASGDDAQTDDSLQKILDKGELILGLDDSFPPMGYRNEDNEIVGFDIDVAKEVCKRLGVELKLQPVDWTANVVELNGGSVDCLWNGMSVTPAREEAMTLSIPYLGNSQAILVLADSDIKTKADLAGKKVGIQAGSSAIEAVEKEPDVMDSFGELVEFKDNMMAVQELKLGTVDAVIADEVVLNYYISTELDAYRVLEDNFGTEQYAIGFRKEDVALCEKVNEILREMKADGSLGDISTATFGKDNTIVE